MVHHFLLTNPYKISIFQMSVTWSFFFWSCTHILSRSQEEKFEGMFLVKIENKGTSLNQAHFAGHDVGIKNAKIYLEMVYPGIPLSLSFLYLLKHCKMFVYAHERFDS